jgi:preprotein translocase subunit SecE
LAEKGKKPAKKGETTVRIVATDDKKPVEKSESPKKAKKTEVAQPEVKERPGVQFASPFRASGRYFKGAWYELRQVRWPNRQATWSFTAALLVFTAFFAALILLLDALFKYLFQLILG